MVFRMESHVTIDK